MKQVNITVTGNVQGVFYRASTKQKADELGIKGCAQNQENDTVYIEAQGAPEALDQFIEWCWEGSKAADVRDVEVDTSKQTENFESFQIM